MFQFLVSDTKREAPHPPQSPQGEEEEREDELPTVVVLREGDISQHEYEEFRKKEEGWALHHHCTVCDDTAGVIAR